MHVPQLLLKISHVDLPLDQMRWVLLGAFLFQDLQGIELNESCTKDELFGPLGQSRSVAAVLGPEG